jgi:hypothetical protein
LQLGVLDHLFGAMTMFANEEMHVVAHDRARIAGVATVLDHFGKAICNDLKRRFAQFEKWILQPFVSL